MNYKEFKAAIAARKAENPAPEVTTMVAPSEARQRIDAKKADIVAKLAAARNK